MQFSTFEPNSLKQAPSIQMIGRYKLEFHLFSQSENLDKTPVVFLGGAFQSFTSFKTEVELVYQTHPVILLDLPSQGSNDQLVPELGLKDFSSLLKGFFEVQGIEQVIMVGISYGSAMATLFAAEYPNFVQRLLVSGITCFRRDTLVLLLEDSLNLLAQGELKAFAATAVSNLVNHNRMQETEVGKTYRRLLYRQVARLNANEQLRYAQNTRRLLRFDGFDKFPTCPTLVATGEFDNFTLPEENANFAASCADAQFAVIEDADHLSQFERRDVTSELFYRFIQDKCIKGIKGTRLFQGSYSSQERRLQPRLTLENDQAVLVDEVTGIQHDIRIVDINFSGCQINLKHCDLTLNENSKGLQLYINGMNHHFHVRIMERHQKNLRCILIQRDVKAADELIELLESIDEFSPHCMPVIAQNLRLG
ncbi:MAG: alpha/beta hydrolase [Oleispira antarctica]|uniref:Hydrolase n=1 Tax=Oleispira antarctica RB-8 TaxID=698738 RepID=R4YN59_OLEAN|nr:alpha/beta hydrolase [Oleispira antarctica]MBQ0791233.1 alpha/beta hydrolase [Oleispira antarctica]CCK76250.1 hydrolase [Oleispira antarctica RB-8]